MANVEDTSAVEMAARRWLSGDPAMEREVEAVRGRIQDEMEPTVVASRLLEYLRGETQNDLVRDQGRVICAVILSEHDLCR